MNIREKFKRLFFRDKGEKALDSVMDRSSDEDIRTQYNPYYRRVSSFYRFAKIITVFALCIFILATFLFFGESFTYENARYILRDLGQIISEDSGTPIDRITIDPDGDMDYAIFKGSIVIAGESGVDIYSPSGTHKLRDDRTFASPEIVTSDRYCIVYSPGAYNLCVYNTVARVYDMVFEYPILDASVSDNGDIAVLTSGREYRCTVYLYNSDFKLTATYNKTNYPSSVSISKDGGALYICVFGTENGEFLSKLYRYESGKSEPSFLVEASGALPYDIQSQDNGSVALLTQYKLLYYDASGNKTAEYDYDAGISSYSATSSGISLLTSDKNARVFSYDVNAQLLYENAYFDVICSYCYDNRTFLQKKDAIIFENGGVTSSRELPPGARHILYDRGYAFACYPDKILSFKCD